MVETIVVVIIVLVALFVIVSAILLFRRKKIYGKLFGRNHVRNAGELGLFDAWVATKEKSAQMIDKALRMKEGQVLLEEKNEIERKNRIEEVEKELNDIIEIALKRMRLNLSDKLKIKSLNQMMRSKRFVREYLGLETNEEKVGLVQSWLKRKFIDPPKKKQKKNQIKLQKIVFPRIKKGLTLEQKQEKERKRKLRIEKRRIQRAIKKQEKMSRLGTIYNEMVTYLKTGQIKKLIQLIRKVNSRDLKEILENFSEIREIGKDHNPKIDQILKKAKTKKDIIELLKEEIINGLNETHQELKRKISSARKRGFNVKHEDLVLMTLPSKIKIFAATFKKKDYENSEKVIKDVENTLNKLLNSNGKKDKNKGDEPNRSKIDKAS